MNSDLTVREVMNREFVGVSEADTVRDAAALMLEERAEAVVVLRGSTPEGLLTQADVVSAAVDGADLADLTVADAMRTDVPSIAPDASVASATDRMSGLPTRHLLVETNGELAGLISENDVVTASTLNRDVEADAARDPDPGGEAVVAGAVTGTNGSETTAEEGYSNQGICEVCGSLSRDLSTFNGQLVCVDCKDV